MGFAGEQSKRAPELICAVLGIAHPASVAIGVRGVGAVTIAWSQSENLNLRDAETVDALYPGHRHQGLTPLRSRNSMTKASGC